MVYGDGRALAAAMRGFLADFAPERFTGRLVDAVARTGVEPARVLCLGKAAPALARAAASAWRGVPGLVYGTSEEPVPSGFGALWGDHPSQTPGNVANTQRVRAWLEDGSGPLLACVSGGGSALLAEPAPPWTAEENGDVVTALLNAGAAISEVNAVRARLSQVKAGGLLASVGSWPVVTAVWSDVGPRHAKLVSSGPTLPWRSAEDAEDVVARYGVTLPRDLPGPVHASTRRGDAWFVLCDALALRRGIAQRLSAAGCDVREMPVREGESAEALAERIARAFMRGRSRRPLALVGAGEAPVRASGSGRGGRCSHLAAALTSAMAAGKEPSRHWMFAAIATDGVDGSGGGGAFADSKALPSSVQLERALDACDTATLWDRMGTLLPRRPSGNNLRDVWAMVEGGGA